MQGLSLQVVVHDVCPHEDRVVQQEGVHQAVRVAAAAFCVIVVGDVVAVVSTVGWIAVPNTGQRQGRNGEVTNTLFDQRMKGGWTCMV